MYNVHKQLTKGMINIFSLYETKDMLQLTEDEILYTKVDSQKRS